MSAANGQINASGQSTATGTTVPDVPLVSIEHPCIVKNFAIGFKSLGGEQQVKHVLEPASEQGNERAGKSRRAQKRQRGEPVVGVSLRPHDPLAKKLESTSTSTRNVLVKVTVPKWTGGKRKRGSDEPFTEANTGSIQHNISAPDLIRRLEDNAGKYGVQPVGKVETTHRFNSLPDLQIRERDVPIMQELRDHATIPDYDTLKNFHIDLTPGSNGISALPRPSFFIPPGFEEENAFEMDAANQSSKQKVNKAIQLGSGTSEATPRPHRKLRPTSAANIEPPSAIKPAVDTLNTFLATRPIASRLVLQNNHPDILMYKIDAASTWLGTKNHGGPWKDCLVRNGIDPTSDPKYRFYQVVSARPHKVAKKDKEGADAHVFDGRTKVKGSTYQYCDITDPVLAPVINTPHFRSKEEGYGGPVCGWYHNGTMAKMKIIMADKLRRMHSKEEGEQSVDERVYAAVAALPDKIEDGTACEVDGALFGEEARQMGMLVKKEALRAIVKAGGGGGGAGAGDGDPGGEMEMEGTSQQQSPGMTEEMVVDPSLAAMEGVDGPVVSGVDVPSTADADAGGIPSGSIDASVAAQV